MNTLTAPKGFIYLYDYDGCAYFYKALTAEHGVVISNRDKEYNGVYPFFLADLAKSSIQEEWDMDNVISTESLDFIYDYQGYTVEDLESYDFMALLNNTL